MTENNIQQQICNLCGNNKLLINNCCQQHPQKDNSIVFEGNNSKINKLQENTQIITTATTTSESTTTQSSTDKNKYNNFSSDREKENLTDSYLKLISTTSSMYINEEMFFSPELNLKTGETVEHMNIEDLCNTFIRDLNEYGVCVLENFLGEERGRQVLNEVTNLYSAGVFKDGQLVSNNGQTDQRHIRGDKITWIDGKEPGCNNIRNLIYKVDSVIKLAKMKNNGKIGNYNISNRTKAMVACYPGSGTHYVKHVDNPNSDGRCITAIYYLNLNWDVRLSGGLLRIFPEGVTDKVVDIEPLFDRILFFWSDRRNPHEVQPAHRTRYAITLWYIDTNQKGVAVEPFKCKDENN